jgi:hypothetical protein
MTSRTATSRTALALLICIAVAPAAARADDSQKDQQDQQDRTACMADAQSYCSEFIPDREKVAHCLMSKRSQISDACREALKHFK